MDVAGAGQRSAVGRARALAGHAPVESRSGAGWLAVRSGAASNDLNVVVAEPGLRPEGRLLVELARWFGELPASWLIEAPDAGLTRVLVRHGWRPERTGRWCGREGIAASSGPREAAVLPVAGDERVDRWLGVARDCGWFDDEADRDVRRDLLRSLAGDPRHGAWVATIDERTVGMVSAWCAGAVVEVVDVAVVEAGRRRGVGRRLVGQALSWAAARGADEVVAAPSPLGWRLFESLGFDNVPVEPDVTFYRP